MSTVKLVAPEHVDILREYLASDCGGAVVLVYPDAHEDVEALDIEDGESVDYDFGGESDLMVDVVTSKEHHFVRHFSDEEE